MKKLCLLLILLLLLALSVWRISHSTLNQDISFFLPDHNENIVRQLDAITDAPLARLVLVELAIDDETQQPLLNQGIEQFQASLAHDLFPVIFPPASMPDIRELVDLLPFLLRALEPDWLQTHTDYPHIKERLVWFKRQMAGPGSTVYKPLLQNDTLGLLMILEKALHASGLMQGMDGQRMLMGRPVIMSKDGKAVLLVLLAHANPNDSRQAQDVLRALQQSEHLLPPAISMRAISSYHYAMANVRSIEADMKLILPISFAALALLTLLWLRSWRGLLVLFFPPLLFAIAWGILDISGVGFSGISIGFGAVLLGIVIDYAIHSFYAWRYGLRGMQITRNMLRPLIYIFTTSLCAFSPLLFSSLPGLRQMGLLTLITLALGVIVALFILPQLWGGKKDDHQPTLVSHKLSYKKIPMAILLSLVCILAYLAKDVQMDGNLRSLGVRDQAITSLEKEFAQRWSSGLRGSAFLQISGDNENQVLSVAEAVEQWLFASLPANSKIIDPLYLYPSPKQRQTSLRQWTEQINRAAISADLEQAAAELGYNDAVFNSFRQWLGATTAPIYSWPEDNPLLNDVRNILMPTGNNGQSKLYMLFDDNEHIERLAGENPFAEVVVVSPSLFGEQLSKDIKNEFTWLGLAALAGVVICVLLLYRNLSMALVVIAPMLAGAAAILLYVLLQARPLNLFSVAALPLLLGLSIDYGIFMTNGCRTANYKKSRQAVLLSALTTLAGFGSLILATHPALHSLGIIVSIGILGALPVAMLIPWLTNSNKYGK